MNESTDRWKGERRMEGEKRRGGRYRDVKTSVKKEKKGKRGEERKERIGGEKR